MLTASASTPSLTRGLASAIAATKYDDLPVDVIAAARRLILDGIAVAVAGARERPPRILADYFASSAKEGPCDVIGFGLRLAPAAACAINGASMHVLDFEPMWSPANHAASPSVPVGLAIGQFAGRSGREILTSIVVGCEVMGRLRAAEGLTEARAINFHFPGVVGPLGAAALGAHLLGLAEAEIAYALGIAGSSAGALLANAGSMTKCLHTGHAASAGAEAALLARAGYTANAEILDAPSGYCSAFMPSYDDQPLREFGTPFRIVSPGYAIKMFPSQYGTHFAITAALEARQKIDGAAAIRRIRIRGPEMPYINRPSPSTGLEGKFSFQYTTAAAILDGKVDVDTFTDRRLHADDLQRLLPLIEFVPVPENKGYFEDMHVEVVIEMVDGLTSFGRCDAPRGYLDKGPPLATEEHLTKVRHCLGRALPASRIEEVVAMTLRFEHLDAKEIGTLMRLIAEPACQDVTYA